MQHPEVDNREYNLSLCHLDLRAQTPGSNPQQFSLNWIRMMEYAATWYPLMPIGSVRLDLAFHTLYILNDEERNGHRSYQFQAQMLK